MNKNKVLFAMMCTLALTTFTVKAAEPLAFRGVMKELGRNMETVAGAIAYEDWATVEKTAHLIGEHPKPSLMERARILAFVGTSMSKFKEFDEQTHKGAHELVLAANAKDGMQVIATFQKIQEGCLGCHQNFRASFVEHFYGSKK